MIWPSTSVAQMFIDGDKVELTEPVLLSCGCGSIIARWATLRQLLPKIPEVKPKTSKLVVKWLEENDMYTKCPLLKTRTYGVVVSPDGRWVDINSGATMKTVEEIMRLVSKEDK